MRRIVLAALVAAVAVVGVAWAAWAAWEANGGNRAFAVCIQAHTAPDSSEFPNGSICYMKHMPESKALEHAEKMLKACAASAHPPKSCQEERAYIKQRWGY